MEPEIDADRTADLVELLWSVHKPIGDLIRLDDLTSKNDLDNNNNNSSALWKKAILTLTPSSADASTSTKKRSDSDDMLSPTSLDVHGSTPPPPSPASDVSREFRHEPADLSIDNDPDGEDADEDTSFASHPADFLPPTAKAVSESSTPPATTTSQSTPAVGGEDSGKYSMEALFQLMTKMQRSMETMSKRFVNVEDAVFDLLDETRCPIRRGRVAEKSVQTELSIGCQGLPPHMLDRRRGDGPTDEADGDGKDAAKSKSIFRVSTVTAATMTVNATAKPTKPVMLPDKFNFDSSDEDSEDTIELPKADDKKKDTAEHETEDGTADNSSPSMPDNSSPSTPSDGKTPPSDVVDEQPVVKKTAGGAEEKRRCVWATDDSDDTDSAELNDQPPKKQSVHFDPKDNIPDEMKSAASLPWHDDKKVWKDRVWKERQLQFEALHRQLNKTMAEHMINRPKAAAPVVGQSAAGRVGTAEKLGVSPFNRRPITPTTTDSPNRAPGGQHAFFERLQCDYVLSPNPRAPPPLYQQKQQSPPHHVSRLPTRRAVYPPNGGGGGHHHRESYGYYNSRPHSSSQRRSLLLTGPNAIVPPPLQAQKQHSQDNQYHRDYTASTYHNSQSQRSVSQPRRQPPPEDGTQTNGGGYADPKQSNTVGYGDGGRHHRRLVEAFKLNTRIGGHSTEKLQPGVSMGRLPEKYNKSGYTRRGSGVYTTDEEEGGKK